MIEEIPSDLLDLVKNAVKSDVQNYDVEILKNGKGEGFVSEVNFITFTHKITDEKIQLIVKQERIKNGETVERYREICQNEIYFYDVVAPYLQKFYRSVSKKELEFIPKCFGASNLGRAKIILENLIPQGFTTYDKTKPLTDEHCRLIFETYGNYHGVSMALRELDNEHFQKIIGHKENYFKKAYKEDLFCEILVEKMQEIQAYFDEEKDKLILDKLRHYEKNCASLIIKCMDDGDTNGVILHGDCWSNNLMFKYDDEGQLKTIKLLDFQLVSYGNPVFDLSYSLYSGACEETLSKLDDYQDIYHISLSKTLKEFGLEANSIYPVIAFKDDWKKFCKYGFPLGLFLWKVKLVEKDDAPDFSEKTSNPNTVRLSEERQYIYRRRVIELVNHMYGNDFF